MPELAVPDTTSVKDISGEYSLNKTISDSSANLLYMQNVSWIIRQAVSWSAVDIGLKQTTLGDGKIQIHQVQLSTGGQRNDEHWIVDGQSRDKESRVWGAIAGYHKYAKLSEIDVKDSWLTEGWEQACIHGDIIESQQHSDVNGWEVQQVIGFAEIDGVRRHVRRIIGTKGSQVEKVRMIYDWKHPLSESSITFDDEEEKGSSALSDDAMPDL